MARNSRLAGALAIAGALAAAPCVAGDRTKTASDNYDVLYARYLEAARATRSEPPQANANWMAGLTLDSRARQVNDLLTVRVFESIEAVGTADSQLTKSSSGTASAGKWFGLEGKLPEWLDATNLATAKSDTKFKGGGTTTRSGELTATITARVVEVLPNGDLVLEGAREIDINGDRQIVVLTGVVRQVDIDRSNTVASPRIGQLQIRYFGRGLIKDNLKPGWLIRVLNKIF
jgi:flagellar L-ring protein precursor FlgH